MANRRDIKRRINSVVNTQKITKAMKLVSAAKFARASQAVSAARPYSVSLRNLTNRLVQSAKADIESPLIQVQTEKKALLVVFSSDRGLCGSLNNNLFKFLRKWLDEKKGANEGVEFELVGWGRKAVAWAKRQKEKLREGREKFLDKPDYALARKLADQLIEFFLSGQYQTIYIAMNEFKSALSQEPRVLQFLPLAMTVDDKAGTSQEQDNANSVIVEPDIVTMIEQLFARQLASTIFQVLLDNVASEHGARMTAMESATNNAAEVRKKLTLKYNRARQAAITNELIEIISGAEAL